VHLIFSEAGCLIFVPLISASMIWIPNSPTLWNSLLFSLIAATFYSTIESFSQFSCPSTPSVGSNLIQNLNSNPTEGLNYHNRIRRMSDDSICSVQDERIQEQLLTETRD
jgi:hypothetical protein